MSRPAELLFEVGGLDVEVNCNERGPRDLAIRSLSLTMRTVSVSGSSHSCGNVIWLDRNQLLDRLQLTVDEQNIRNVDRFLPRPA